jgi:hypothetical protein
MARRLPPNRRFSRPIALTDGTKLETLADAANFLARLSGDQISAPIYYAHVQLTAALESGRAYDTETARLELIRAFRSIRRLQ